MRVSGLHQAPHPLKPALGDGLRVALPEVAVEQLERKRAVVADGTEVGNHFRQIGDSVANHDAVVVGLRERVGIGGHVVDVEVGQPAAGKLEQIVNRTATANHVEDIGDDGRLILTPSDQAQRSGPPGVVETTARTSMYKSEKRGVQAARNRPSKDRKCRQRVELGI